MFWVAYNVLFAIGFVLMLPRFLYRMWRRGGYRRHFAQRFACYAPDERARLAGLRPVWVHAVSVGEIFVAIRLVNALRKADPELTFVITTTTSTGHKVAREKMDPRDCLLYFPLDFPPISRRALRHIDPRALILTESELWPNIIRLAHARGVPVILNNGRISTSSFAGYRKVRVFFRRVLADMNLLLVQSQEDKDRLEVIGADPDTIRVMGSTKYDIDVGDTVLALPDLLARAGIGPTDPVLLGGSTWPGEEAALVRIASELRDRHPDLKLILVPRHVERRAQIEAELTAAGVDFVRRSDLDEDRSSETRRADVLLVDTTGELQALYACATVIFVGKSLTSQGGQNMIEPAAHGKCVIVGPHTENFPVVVSELLEAKGLIRVQDEESLKATVDEMLSDPDAREGYARRAEALVDAKRGASERSARLILECLSARGAQTSAGPPREDTRIA